MHVAMAASSSNAWHLYLPFPNRPVVPSSFVGSPGDELVQLAHEPTEAAQAFAQLGDTFRTICQGADLLPRQSGIAVCPLRGCLGKR